MSNSFTMNELKVTMNALDVMAKDNKAHFIALDGVMGDSDLGLTMEAIFSAAAEYVSDCDETDIGAVLAKSGVIMAKAAPSTMGTLVATGFMRGGKALKGADVMDAAGFRNFLKAFVEGIMERGKSKPGEKTIIDALYPAYEAADKAVAEGKDMPDTTKAAALAASKGVEATKTMVAQHGRAAYFGEKSREAQDAGATVGALIVKTFADQYAIFGGE